MSCEQHRKKSRSGPQKGQEPDSDASPLALDVAVVVPNSKQMQKKACSSWCLLFFLTESATHVQWPFPATADHGPVRKRNLCPEMPHSLSSVTSPEMASFHIKEPQQLEVSCSGWRRRAPNSVRPAAWRKYLRFIPQVAPFAAGMVVQKSHMVGKSYERWGDIGWIQVLRFTLIYQIPTWEQWPKPSTIKRIHQRSGETCHPPVPCRLCWLKIAGNWWCSSKINNFQSPGATDFEIHLNTYRKIIGNIPSSHHQISRDSWLDLLLQGGMATSKENLEMQTDQARMTCARSRSKVRFKWC